MKYKINPFPAVRVNGKKGAFAPRAIAYHKNMNDLRLLVKAGDYSIKEVMEALISGDYTLKFVIKMPDSWSKKKKLKYNNTPHRQTPDGDNLWKAFTDTVFYNQKDYNDSEIFDTSCMKYWGEEGYIEFNISTQ